MSQDGAVIDKDCSILAPFFALNWDTIYAAFSGCSTHRWELVNMHAWFKSTNVEIQKGFFSSKTLFCLSAYVCMAEK
jgi:hypothetical protein